MECNQCGEEMVFKKVIDDAQNPNKVLYFIEFECLNCGELSYGRISCAEYQSYLTES
jgi:uncharacterized Zn finger protein